jgi:S-adenosyl methyltransferase
MTAGYCPVSPGGRQCPGLALIVIFSCAANGGMLAAATSSDGKDAMEPGFAAAEIDTSKPHPARMYNAYLGGKTTLVKRYGRTSAIVT